MRGFGASTNSTLLWQVWLSSYKVGCEHFHLLYNWTWMLPWIPRVINWFKGISWVTSLERTVRYLMPCPSNSHNSSHLTRLLISTPWSVSFSSLNTPHISKQKLWRHQCLHQPVYPLYMAMEDWGLFLHPYVSTHKMPQFLSLCWGTMLKWLGNRILEPYLHFWHHLA